MILLLIAIGGAIGALARYGLATWAYAQWGAAFPFGTFIINVSGSILLGFIMQLAEVHVVSPETRAALAIGFCGAFTTFSTFSYETVRLMQEGEWLYAGANVVGSVLVSLLGVVIGLGAAGMLIRTTS